MKIQLEAQLEAQRSADSLARMAIQDQPSSCLGSGIVGGGKGQRYRFTVLAEGILRIEWAADGTFEDRPSSFAYTRDEATVPEFKIRDTDGKLEIITKRFHLTYDKRDFDADGLSVDVFGYGRWRWGEKPSNLGGTYRTLDMVDGKYALWYDQDIQLEPGVVSQSGYAVLDDSKSMLFDAEKGFIAPRRPGADQLDYYLFAYGHDYREAVKDLYTISGSTPLLPRWALGNWWSRYYEYTTETYLALMDKFKSEKIPLSVSVIDMDWHLVRDQRVVDAGRSGWTGYTWNRELFPDPPAFLAELHKRKLITTLNDHPADGIAPYEDKYKEVAKFLGLDPSAEDGVPFDAASTDYLKAYFDIVLKSLEEDGCDFWWIDWQQGTDSGLKNVDPLWILNHYHFKHIVGRNKLKNPIIFSRYAGPGSHRYPVGFSGDTITTWASLAYQPEFTATASNVGYGWWSHDIGGHQFGVRDDELTVRWVQLGVLSPIMRLHSTKNKWVTKEPWRLPADQGSVISHWLRFRHRLLPYLYTMNIRASQEGAPLVQPLYWAFEDANAYEYRNQYFFGTEMLVIPITSPQDAGARLGQVQGWLPPGKWVDFFTGLVYEGGRRLWLSRTLSDYPVFLRPGSIVPLDASSSPENGAENPQGFEVLVVVGAPGEFTIIEDPADDAIQEDKNHFPRRSDKENRREFRLEWKQAEGILKINAAQPLVPHLTDERRSWTIRFLSACQGESPELVNLGLHRYNIEKNSTGLVAHIPDLAVSETASIYIGPDPHLRNNDVAASIEAVIRDAQIHYDTKDKIWAVLSNKETSLAWKISELEMMEMNDAIRKFLMECLLAE